MDPEDFASVENAPTGSDIVLTVWTPDGESIPLMNFRPVERSTVEKAANTLRVVFQQWMEANA